ncbi:carboxypeptidase regulatory-like domain-containing protein [Granulicella sp. L46]|uniref:TonB-dependent receptor n=1 Tax=Granulicella sp. L46 TaxID=1641865 RepID=UPI0020B17343|nr:carboxypeptidase regulatory-like domain-containing protein [Granulicella sp. L46]
MNGQTLRIGRVPAWARLHLNASIRVAFVAIGVLFANLHAHSQIYNGEITGNVTDTSGAAIPNALITAIDVGTNTKYSAKSSAAGEYTIPQLPIGTYAVHAQAAGFKEEVVDKVQVHVSTNTNVLISLQVGAVNEKVLVKADAVQVQTTSAAVGEVISGTQVRELPLNGENFVGLTQLSPGVSPASSYDGTSKGLAGGVNFSVNGNPYTNNLFLVDGVNNNDLGSNRGILVYPSVDTIAEFKMIRNSYGPEYGQASGAIISITTKSGTNMWHGGVFYAGRNDFLDTNDWVHNHLNQGKAKLRRNDFGYNVSGPVLKNKLFL